MTSSPQVAASGYRPVELRDYWVVLRSRWYGILAAMLVGTVLLSGFALITPPTYKASTNVLLLPLTSDPLERLDRLGGIDMSTELQVARSRDVGEQAWQLLDSPPNLPPEALQEQMSVAVAEDAEVLRFLVEAADPETAAERADAFATGYLAYRNAQGRQAIEQVRGTLETRLADVLAERVALEEELAQLRDEGDDADLEDLRATENSLALVNTRQALAQSELEQVSGFAVSGGRIISPAIPPESPAGLGLPLAALLGLVLGAIVGMVIALLLNSVDTRLRDGDNVSRILSAPPLGFVEDPHPLLRLRLKGDPSRGQLARIAVTLDAVMDDHRPKSLILLDMGDEGDGRQIVEALAEGFASRQSAVVIASKHTEPLEAESVFEQVSRIQRQEAGQPAWVQVREHGLADHADLSTSDLGLSTVNAVRQLIRHYDLVVASVPPLDVSTAALDLAADPTTVIVPVIRLGHTTRDALRLARRDLMLSRARIVGSIVIGPRRAWGTVDVLHGLATRTPSGPAPATRRQEHEAGSSH